MIEEKFKKDKKALALIVGFLIKKKQFNEAYTIGINNQILEFLQKVNDYSFLDNVNQLINFLSK
jgi:hypothetical protein